MFWVNAAITVLLIFFVVVSLLMCLVILMQRSKQEGLGAAFGGGFTESIWGAQTSQVLVKTTVWLAALFFIISIALARLHAWRSAAEHSSSLQSKLLQAPAVSAATPAPAATSNVPASAAPTNAVPAAAPAPAATNPAPAKPAAK